MKVTRIQDKYNPDKVWMIKRMLVSIGVLA